MHPTHSSGQHDGAPEGLPPRVRPGVPENKENGQCDNTSGDGDKRRPHNIAGGVLATVVGNGSVAEVVHATDC